MDRKYDWPQQFKCKIKKMTENMIGLSSLRQAPAIKRTRAISYQEGNKPCPRQKIRRGNQPNIKSARMIQKTMGLPHKNALVLK